LARQGPGERETTGAAEKPWQKRKRRRKEALEADAAAEQADREKDLEDVRQEKILSPAWARWEKIAWPGRNIMEVGMS
jgi:hypothetical protein